MTESIYDRIDIIFAGQALTARPCGFVMDKDQNPIGVETWETTCPNCGCAVQFGPNDVAILDDKTYVCCPECKAGQDEKIRVKSDELSIAKVGQNIGQLQERTVVPTDRGCPFIDPIDAGIFRTDFPAQTENPFKPDLPIVLDTTPVDNDAVKAVIELSKEKEEAKDAETAKEVAKVQERAKKNVQARKAEDEKEIAAVVESAKKKAPPNMVLGMGASPPDE